MSDQTRRLTAHDRSGRGGAVSRRRLLGYAAAAPVGAVLAMRLGGAAVAQQATPILSGQRGGSVTMAVEGDWLGVDPHTNAAFASLFAWEKTYQSLVTFDDQLNIVPDLAVSWEIPDPLTYIFHLRQGVTFHHGDPFTAADVVFWLERINNPDLVVPYRSWFNSIEKVEAVDPNTARFILSSPYSPLLANLASMRGSAIIPRAWAGTVDVNQQASGTGPYKLTSVVPQDSYRWEFNPNYWETGLPYIETADNKLLLEPAARLTAIQTGSANYTTLPGDLTGQMEGSDVNLLMGDKAWYWHLQINCSRAPLTDVRVRQAIGLAIDHQEIIDKVLGGFASLTGPVPTGHTDWYIPVDQLPYKVDVDQAKALLAEANLADGFKTTYKANTGVHEDVATAQIIKERLKAIGIDVEIIQLDTTRWVSETQPPKSDYDLRLNGNSFYPDADGYLYNHYHSTGSFNQVLYKNPAYDDIVTKARQLVDHEERRQLYFQAQQILLDEVPVVPLWNGKNIEALSPNLQGYRQSYTGRRLFFDETWLQS